VTRTTVDIAEPVLQELKARQRREGGTLGALISEMLAEALAADARTDEPPLRWHTRAMGEPLVDLEDKDALWAVLDDH
jgi:hypothetical protein